MTLSTDDKAPAWWMKVAGKLKWSKRVRGQEKSQMKTRTRAPTPMPSGMLMTPSLSPTGVRFKSNGKGEREDKNDEEMVEEIERNPYVKNRHPKLHKANVGNRKDVFRFTELPRELRDEVYRYLFVQPYPLAAHQSYIMCHTAGCGRSLTACPPRLPIKVLLTCRQIHNEGKLVMYQENSWSLQTAARIMDQRQAILLYNKHLFDRSTRLESTINIRSLDFVVHLAPRTHRYLSKEEIFTYRGTALWKSLLQLYQGGRFFSVCEEADECDRSQLILNHVAMVQQNDFPHLQSIMISLIFHEAGPDETRTCDTQLKIQVNLCPDEGGFRVREIGPLEARRQFLTPLAYMENLQSVIVRRQVRHSSGTQNRTAARKKRKVERVWKFTSMRAMLFAAGYNFENFSRYEEDVSADEKGRQDARQLGLGVWLGA